MGTQFLSIILPTCVLHLIIALNIGCHIAQSCELRSVNLERAFDWTGIAPVKGTGPFFKYTSF